MTENYKFDGIKVSFKMEIAKIQFFCLRYHIVEQVFFEINTKKLNTLLQELDNSYFLENFLLHFWVLLKLFCIFCNKFFI